MTVGMIHGPRLSLVDSQERTFESLGLEKLKHLGSGDPSEVFLVKDATGQLFALKRYKARDEYSEDYPKEYLDHIFEHHPHCKLADMEAKLGACFQGCPHVVQIYNSIEISEEGKTRTYLFMEYIEGNHLYSLDKKLSVVEYKKYASELIEALKIGLEHSLVHEDLHSGNILITSCGHLKLIDVGSFSDPDDEPNIKHFASNLQRFMTLFLTLECETSDELEDLTKTLDSYFKEFKQSKKQINDITRDFHPLLDKLNSVLKPPAFVALDKV